MKSKMFHHQVKVNAIQHEINAFEYIWKEELTDDFDEMIVSWNALRPIIGSYSFFISVKTDHWSEWIPYAYWSHDRQHGSNSSSTDDHLRVFQDEVKIQNGAFASGFQVKIVASDGACFLDFYTLHVCITNTQKVIENVQTGRYSTVDIEIPLISQMKIEHPRNRDLCASTSTTAVVNFLAFHKNIHPASFAEKAYDHAFDIFGNWVLNIAQASAILGSQWNCSVQRLHGFECIYERLCQGIPVVVSVLGPLTGSATPYSQGHLMAIKGYDAETQQILCMDPAFPSDRATNTSYSFNDFMAAWARRRYVAFIFEKKI